jgi:hypothetical protein
MRYRFAWGTQDVAVDVGPDSGRKTRVTGVGDRQHAPKAGSGITWCVLNPLWSELEPTRGQYVWDKVWRDIDDAAAAGCTGVKLRTDYGVEAPGWAKDIASYSITDPQDGHQTVSVCWWDPDVAARIEAMDDELAARLDGHPMVREVFMSSHGSEFSTESQIRQFMEPANLKAMIDAGYDDAVDEAVLWEKTARLGQRWPSTPGAVFISGPRQRVLSRTQKSRDFPAAKAYAEYCVSLGIAIGPNSADVPGFDHDENYLMQQAIPGAVLETQTATLKKVGDRDALILTGEKAAEHGYSTVEWPAGYQNLLSRDDNERISALLAANA